LQRPGEQSERLWTHGDNPMGQTARAPGQLSRGFSPPSTRQPSDHSVDGLNLTIDLVADSTPDDQGDVRVELGVLELQGSAYGERSGHDELQAQTDGGKNPRRRLGRHRAGLGATRG